MQVVDGTNIMFRCARQTDNITHKMLEDKTFIDKNPEFLKLIPNFVQYWMGHKKDFFAKIRQLAKVIMFLTVNANEIHCPKLLKSLHDISDYFQDTKVNDPLKDATCSMCNHLMNGDSGTCCIYFTQLF